MLLLLSVLVLLLYVLVTVVVVVLDVAFHVDFVVVLVVATMAEASVVVLDAAFVVVIRSSSCTVYCGPACLRQADPDFQNLEWPTDVHLFLKACDSVLHVLRVVQ